MENKIKTIEELAKIIKEEREKGRKVAQCHGCFDLVHIGHIRHFKEAKKNADVLVVTVTPDRFITKGPGRPVFNETLRLEMLANLEVVDYVGLNNEPDAVSLIKKLSPDFYVKGDEYKDLAEGKRIEEKEAIEECGGKMLFTSDITFSSSSLLNANFDFLPQEVNEFLNTIRKRYTRNNIQGFIEKLKSLKILVVGEPIIDEYNYCKTVGTVSKSPTLSAIYNQNLKMAGGALAVARHLAEFAGNISYVGIAGDKDNEFSFMKEKLHELKIDSDIMVVPERYSIVKRRFVSGNYPTTLEIQNAIQDDKAYKLFEIAFMNDSQIDKDTEDKICHLLEKKLGEQDLVILADFGHGMITSKIAEVIAQKSRWWSVNAQTNSTNYGFNLITKYKGPNFICLDEREARLPFADRHGELEKLINELSERIQCKEIMVTRGRDGLALKLGNFYYAPALVTKTVDPVGAGDAVFAMASMCQYSKMPPLITAFFSAVMGALATQIVCNLEPVRKNKFIKFINGTLIS